MLLFYGCLQCPVNLCCLFVFQAAEQQSTEEDVSILHRSQLSSSSPLPFFLSLILPLFSHLCDSFYANTRMQIFFFFFLFSV